MRPLSSYSAATSGSIMPIFAISILSIVALVGATLALSMDSRSANSLQHSADSAALGGAIAFLKSESPKLEDRKKVAIAQANALATQNSEYSLVDLDSLAVTEDEYGQHLRMEVDVGFKPTNAAAGMTGRNATVEIRSRAVAMATWGFPLCLLALAEDGQGLTLTGAGDLTAPNCAIWSNSSASDGIYISESAQAITRSMCSVGGASGGSVALAKPRPSTKCEPIPDPVADWVPPEIGRCDTIGGFTFTKGSGISADLSPGVFCGGLWATEDKVTLKPGTYYIKDGPLVLNGEDELIGEGVTFIMSGRNASVQISGDGILRLTAPTSGPFAGIALAEDRTTRKESLFAAFAARRSGTTAVAEELVSTIKGNGQIHIEGLIYLPNQTIEITGSGWGKKSSPYLQMISKRIQITELGGLYIDFNPSGTSVPVVIEPTREARLVE